MEGYNSARYLLVKKYGKLRNIARSGKDGLIKEPPLKANDLQGRFKLSQELQKCDLILTELGYQADINSTVTLRGIARKLAKFIRSKWVEKADLIIQCDRELNFFI